MIAPNRRWLFVLGLLALMLALLTLVVVAGLNHDRYLISSGGGQISQGNLVLQSAVGQPVIGGNANGLTLCSGFLSGACPAR